MQKRLFSTVLRVGLALMGCTTFSPHAQTPSSDPVSLSLDLRTIKVFDDPGYIGAIPFAAHKDASPFTPFDATVSGSVPGHNGITVSSSASQVSSATPEHINATGSLSAQVQGTPSAGDTPSGTAGAELFVRLHVSQPVGYMFMGTITGTNGGGINANGLAQLISSTFGAVFATNVTNSASSQASQVDVQYSGVLLPGDYSISAFQRLSASEQSGAADYHWDLQLGLTNLPNLPPSILWVAPNGSLLPTFPDITALENAAIATIPFKIFDFQRPNAQAVVSAHSSNQNLIPDSGLQLNGQTLTLAPLPDQSGSALITLTVSDGGLTNQASFNVTIKSTAPPPPGTFVNLTPINIPDQGPGTPYPSTIQVSGLDGVIQSVTVELDGLTHTWPRDIGVLLVGPDGQAALLMEQAGYGKVIFDVNLTFDDAAPNLLPAYDQIVSGTYRPTLFNQYAFDAPAPPGPYEAALSVFRGRAPNGVWSLYVFDDAKSDHGVLADGWRLTIHTVPNTPPTLSYIHTDGEQTPFPDQSTLANVPIGPIDLIAFDQEQTTEQLTFTGHSSNPTLVPDSNIIFRSGTTASATEVGAILRDVMIIPAPDQTGSATITLTVSDGFAQTSASFNLDVVSPPYQAQTFVNPSSIAIPDHGTASPYPSTIEVSGLSGAVANVSVRLYEFGHSAIHDVRILLVSPTGESAMLMGNISQYGYGIGGIIGFDDSAPPMGALNPDAFYHPTIGFFPTRPISTAPMPAPAPPPLYRAELAVFRAIPPNGTWSLYVVDDAPQDAGIIAGGWDLTIETSPTSTPSLSAIPDQTLPMNTVSTPIPFTVSDASTPADQLLLGATSSNPALIPDANILLAGSGSSRAVVFTPVAGQTGSAAIQISATNLTQVGARVSFNVTVTSEGTFTTVANPATITIPDQGEASPYPSTVNVNGVSGVINGVTVTLYGLSHTWPEDIEALLVSPTGSNTLLMAAVGSDNSATNIVLQFQDAAANKLTTGPILSGIYRPTVFGHHGSLPVPAPPAPYPAALSVFNGLSPNGTWSLYVFDDAAQDQGEIADGWSLTLSTITAAGPMSLLDTPSSADQPGLNTALTLAERGARFESAAVLPDGQFSCTIRSPVGQGYVIQTSPDGTAWLDVATNTAPIAGFNFIDKLAPAQSQRFYRLRLLEQQFQVR